MKKFFIESFLVLYFLGFLPISAASLLEQGWSSKIDITILASAIDEDLVDFPVHVDLSELPNSFFDSLKAGGADIRVTKADEETILPIELVDIDIQAKTGQLWFKADSLSSQNDTGFVLFYDNPSADFVTEVESQSTWNEAYKAVWHFEDDPGQGALSDSTSTGFDGEIMSHLNFFGEPMSEMTAENSVAGQLGKSFRFNDLNYVRVNTLRTISVPITLPDGNIVYSMENDTFDPETLTISAWINVDPGAPAFIVNKSSDTTSYRLQAGYLYSNTVYPGSFTAAGNSTGNATETIWDNEWHYVVGTYDGINLKYYVDGVLDSEKTLPNFTENPDNYAFTELARYDFRGGLYYRGEMDEVRISDTTHSAAWIKAEYINQSNSNAFLDLDIERNLESLSIADNSLTAGVSEDLVMNFTVPVSIRGGELVIKSKANDFVVEKIDLTSDNVSGDGTRSIRINPLTVLKQGTEYYINLNSDAIEFSDASSFEGFNDNFSWNFRTNFWYDPRWPYRIKLDFTNMIIATNSINLGELDEKIFDHAFGPDIRITKSDGKTELARRIDSFISDEKRGSVTFQNAGIIRTNDTFYIYYGRADASDYPSDHQYGAANVNMLTGFSIMQSNPEEENQIQHKFRQIP